MVANLTPNGLQQEIVNTVKTAPFNTAIKVCQVGFLPSEKKFAMVIAQTNSDAIIWRAGTLKPTRSK
jgi:hypothetical protein